MVKVIKGSKVVKEVRWFEIERLIKFNDLRFSHVDDLLKIC